MLTFDPGVDFTITAGGQRHRGHTLLFTRTRDKCADVHARVWHHNFLLGTLFAPRGGVPAQKAYNLMGQTG